MQRSFPGWASTYLARPGYTLKPPHATTETESYGLILPNWQIVGQRDFNNDGYYDFLWRDANSGALAIWLMAGRTPLFQSGVIATVPTSWSVAGTSDFNYDGKGDILWRDSGTGTVAIWLFSFVGFLI